MNKTNDKYNSPTDSLNGYKTSKLAKSEKRDCVVRAISAAFGITYNQAHAFAKENYNRVDKRGTDTLGYYKANNKFAEEKTVLFGKTMTQIGDVCNSQCVENNIPNLSPRIHRGSKVSKMTVATFMRTYQKGKSISDIV